MIELEELTIWIAAVNTLFAFEVRLNELVVSLASYLVPDLSVRNVSSTMLGVRFLFVDLRTNSAIRMEHPRAISSRDKVLTRFVLP